MKVLVIVGKALRVSARFLIRRYYAVVEVTGRERIPVSGPVVLVANHPNSMFDPAVVGITAVRPVHFVSKAPLFDLPVFGVFMRALGMIPAFRGRDDVSQVGRNTGSLDNAAQWLVRGEAVGIFPEGLSHDLPRVELVRGGAARMAIAAARAGARVIVVPLGLNYERKEEFRSDIWVRVGEPIDVALELPRLGRDDRHAARELTHEIDRRLKSVVVHLEEEKWAPFLPDLEVLLPPVAEFAGVPAAPLRQRKRIADAMNYFLKVDRPRAEAMASAIEKQRAELAGEGLKLRSDVINLHGRKLVAESLRQIGWLLVRFPPAAAGLVHHFVPFGVAHLIIRAFKGAGRDTLAMIRLFLGLPLVALWYVVVWRWLAGWSGSWAATLWTCLMPFAGLRALFFLRGARTTVPTLWHECRLILRRRRVHELRRQQLELRHRLRLFAGDYAKVRRRGESFDMA